MTGKASKKKREDFRDAGEEVRQEQLREDGRRSLAVNLAEGLELSEFLSTLPGGGKNLSDTEAREAFRNAQRANVSGG
jgi:hypothetical protein